MREAAQLSHSSPVLMDRSWASAYAYGTADGCDPEWLKCILEKEPKPDVLVVLLGQRVGHSGDIHQYDTRDGLFDKLSEYYRHLPHFGWGYIMVHNGSDLVPIFPKEQILETILWMLYTVNYQEFGLHDLPRVSS
jgi:thymidylate kinase